METDSQGIGKKMKWIARQLRGDERLVSAKVVSCCVY